MLCFLNRHFGHLLAPKTDAGDLHFNEPSRPMRGEDHVYRYGAEPGFELWGLELVGSGMAFSRTLERYQAPVMYNTAAALVQNPLEGLAVDPSQMPYLTKGV